MSLEARLSAYAAYHRDPRNRALHFLGVPLIMLSILAALAEPRAAFATPARLLVLGALAWYASMDVPLAVGMAAVSGALLALSERLSWGWTAALFLGGWALQLAGHKLEGRKPAFLDDLKQLLVGPLFLLADACAELGLRPELRAPLGLPPDWKHWTPKETASLCFVIKDGRILLIEKKRGLGAGKVNGPGGRRDPGESALDCARRETIEEIGVEPTGLALAGELRFQFVDGYSLRCSVFTATDAVGELKETDEAKPFWKPVAEIPFDDMWTDDRYWIPWMLDGRPFVGTFHFDGDRMLSGGVEPARS